MGRILITGVAGFIGSNLAKHLSENEKNIIFGIDNFSCSSMSNLYPLLKKSNFNFIEHDLNQPLNLTVDSIYHFAGSGDLRSYYEDKCKYALEQVSIIKNIIKITQLNGARLILPTQYCTYQDYNKKLYKYFDIIKFIESLITELIDTNKLNAVFARLGYVYGKNMQKDDRRFIPRTIDRALNNQEINIEYDESYYFTYMDDLIINLETLMNNYSSSDFIDISNKNLYLKSDIAKLIVNYLKSQSKINLKSNYQYNPNYIPNNNVLDNGMQLECKTPVIEGIIETVKNYKLIYYS